MKITLLFIAIVFSVNGFAQVTFQKVYGEGGIYGGAWGSSARQTSDGGYIISGFIADSLIAAYIVKTDYLGRLQWHLALRDSIFEARARVAQETSDGGYIVIGYVEGTYIVLWKLDSIGNITWAKRFTAGSPTQVWSNYGEQTSDGGYIIVGNLTLWPSTNVQMVLIKIDSNGNLSWVKIIGNGNTDNGNYVTQTSDGGYIITGTATIWGSDVILVKTDGSGNITWAKTFNSSNEVGECVQQTSDGGYIIVGTIRPPTDYGNVYLIKTDGNGNLLWSSTYGSGYSHSEGSAVQQTPDGGYIIAGGSVGANWDSYLIKTDSSGNVLWSNVFGGMSSEGCSSVQQTTDGGYVLAGNSYSFGMTGLVYVIKTDSLGVSECFEHEAETIQTYPLTQSNIYAPIVTSEGAIESAVTVIDGIGTVEIVLCEYDAINEYSIHQKTISLFPNPTTSELRIENAELRIREIEICNVLGEKLHEEHLTSNVQRLTISVADFLPGVYFVAVTDDKGNKITKRFIKM